MGKINDPGKMTRWRTSRSEQKPTGAAQMTEKYSEICKAASASCAWAGKPLVEARGNEWRRERSLLTLHSSNQCGNSGFSLAGSPHPHMHSGLWEIFHQKLASFSCLFWLFGREVEAFWRSLKDVTQNTSESKLRLQRNFQWVTQCLLQLGWRLNPPSLPCSQRGLVSFGGISGQPGTTASRHIIPGSCGDSQCWWLSGGWEQRLHQ